MLFRIDSLARGQLILIRATTAAATTTAPPHQPQPHRVLGTLGAFCNAKSSP